MADSITVTSMNCRGFNAMKEVYINHVLNQCDVLFLQEHWLSENSYTYLEILIQNLSMLRLVVLVMMPF